MRFFMTALGMLFFFALAACANLQTISRTTTLPAHDNAQGAKNRGLAIHLDAQQRLVVVNSFQRYCAEPSPDALSAYAASLGLGYSDPSKMGASLAQAVSSSAGSIGLRTQSITLMRDALYRMCEAYSNEEIGPLQVALLLRRSQDLTAVILAVEQLTGAVAANQVILSGSSSAGASASLLSNQQLLDAARKDEEAKTAALKTASDARQALETTTAAKSAEWDTATSNYRQATAPGSAATDQDRTNLKIAMDTKALELEQLKAKLEAAQTQEQTRKQLLAEATKIREAIEAAKDSALTNVVAGTTGAGQMSAPVQRNQLDKDATLYIANAVQAMVFKVLDKRYELDTCMDYLTIDPKEYRTWTTEQRARRERVQQVCADMVSKTIVMQTELLTDSFAPDESTRKLEEATTGHPEVLQKLTDWMAAAKLQMSPTLLLYGRENEALRKQALSALGIK